MLLRGRVKCVAIFWYVLLGVAYMRPKQFKQRKLLAVVGSIVVDGALTCCALLHSMCDLKDTKMNMQHSLLRELTFYEFEMVHKSAEATKNIFSAKSVCLFAWLVGWFG